MDRLERESAVDLLGRESATVFYVNKCTADEKLCGWLFKLGNGILKFTQFSSLFFFFKSLNN
jgi:hypothetical protein